MLNIGIIGLGVVGLGVVEILKQLPQYGARFQILQICSRNKPQSDVIQNISWTSNYNDILNNTDVNLIIELIGGNTDAYKIIQSALSSGKHVITANKMLLAERADELAKLADANKLYLLFEAAVCGGVPVLNTLKEISQFDKINKLEGILSGSCTYILTRMHNEKRHFQEILSDAQKLGYIEYDPSLDISGLDTAHKACILYKTAFKKSYNVLDVALTGIQDVTLEQVKNAEAHSSRIRLVAEISESGIVISPKVLPHTHTLYHVSNNLNGVIISSKNLGEIYIEGQGAGRYPTASAVVLDVKSILNNTGINHFGS